jgi:hypothetical protein
VLPVYAWMLIALPLTQAVGAALQTAGTAAGRRRIVIALVAAVAAWALLRLPFDTPWLPAAQVAPAALASLRGFALLAWPYLAIALLLAATAAWHAARQAPHAAPLGSFHPARRAALLPLLLGLLVTSELLALWWPYRVGARSAIPDASPAAAVAFLQHGLADGQGRFTAVPASIGTPMSPLRFGLADLRGMSALPVARYAEYVALLDPTAVRFVAQTPSAVRSPLLDLAAVRYVVLPRGPNPEPPALLQEDPRLPLAYADAGVRIYENRAALPRVRIAHRAVAVPDAAAARHALQDAWRGATHAAERPRQPVILEPAADGSVPPSMDAPAPSGESVRLVADESDALRIEARLAAPGYVVIADTYYPGWRASVDGADAPIHPADLMFRAVAVPAGAHVVELRYQPTSFRVGLFVAAGALLAIGLLAASAVGRRAGAGRRPKPRFQ